jgi:outer membrane protein TolC
MKNYSTAVAAGVFLLMTVTVYAQEKTESQAQVPQVIVLTADQAVAYADTNSRTLKSAQIDLEMKRRTALYSWNVLVPSVTASGTMSRANEYSTTYADLLNPLYEAVIHQAPIPTGYSAEGDRWSAVGSFDVSLNLSLAYIDSIRASRAAYEAGMLTWDQTKKQNELNVRKLFYGLLLQQENLKVQETSLENARQRAAQSEINFKNGIVPEISMLQAQVSYENQRPNIDKMEQTVSQQLDTFAFLLGMPVGTKIRLDGKIEPHFLQLDADTLYERYGSANPDVVSLKKNISILRMQLSALDFKSYTPALSMGWTYQPVLSDVTGNWASSENWYDNGNLHLTVAWSLSDMLWFSAARQQAGDVRDNIRKLEISLETVEQNNEMQIRKTVDSLEQAKQSILSSSRNITLAQRSYDMTSVAYRNGTTELLDLRDTENQLNLAKIGLLNEQYNYMSYMLDLEYMLNTTLGEEK